MISLSKIDAPDLQPLRNSAEYDQMESELKTAFMNVFDNFIRSRERMLNLYGMPHLGESELMERNLKSDGLAVIRRDAFRIRFLLKAWRARNPRRGRKFIQSYLQTVFPNDWTVDQLWHPIETAAEYPKHTAIDANPETHFLTSRIRVGIGVTAATGPDLTVMAKALRSTLAARLVLEIILSQRFATSYGVSNGMHGMMPVKIKGTLLNITPNMGGIRIGTGVAALVPMHLFGTLQN